MVGSDLCAFGPTLREAWFAIPDHEIPAVMTYGPCSSTVIQEGAPHSEKMRTVIGTGVQRLPLLPADLRHQPLEYVELKQEFKRVRLWLAISPA